MDLQHEHKYKEFVLFSIKKVQPNYRGVPGDMSFITRKCECGKVTPHEYGNTKSMKKLMEEISNG